MRVYTVNVTQQDINEGVRGSCTSCPIAHAWNRATNGGKNLWLGRDNLPANAVQFMDDFDAGRPVSPFTFEMEVY